MYVVGLSGGIGSGKSTVANLFGKLGIHVVDADQLARDAVAPGSLALEKITENFGDAVINDDGSLNRAQLRTMIFNDESSKTWLEKLLHPLIHQAADSALKQATSEYAIYMAPLLLENGLQHFVDRILIVDIDEEQQLQRSTLRDNSTNEKIKKIIASQWPRQRKLDAADDIIDNTGSLNDLEAQVKTLHNHYLQLAKIKSVHH